VVQGLRDWFVGGLSIVDPTGGTEADAARLFLGIGVTGTAQAVALIADLGKVHAVALLLKAPPATDTSVLRAAEAADITVVEVSRGVAWGQLFMLLRRLVEPPEVGLSDDGSGDLFQLASEVSALVDAPITIENTTGGVLAFSPGQEDTDDGRVRAILRRQVPEQYQQMLTEKGAFRELSQSTDPVYIPSFAAGNLPRAAIVARLLSHDAEHRTDLTGTLEVYIDRLGEVSKAAADLHVHPNTFRYRLARLSEACGIDLDDADARLAAMIDLRLYRHRGAR
jgi:hypothetical protein